MIPAQEAANAGRPDKLLVSGCVHLPGGTGAPVAVVRGMVILSRDGQEVGKVAAVVVDNHSQAATHILLCRLPQMPDYRLVSVNVIAQVTGETVALQIHSQDVDGLPVHQVS